MSHTDPFCSALSSTAQRSVATRGRALDTTRRQLPSSLALLHDKLQAAIFTYLRSSAFISNHEFDVLYGVSERAAAAIANRYGAVHLDRSGMLNLVHGIGAPFHANSRQIGSFRNAAERLVQSRTPCSAGEVPANYSSNGSRGESKHDSLLIDR